MYFSLKVIYSNVFTKMYFPLLDEKNTQSAMQKSGNWKIRLKKYEKKTFLFQYSAQRKSSKYINFYYELVTSVFRNAESGNREALRKADFIK